MTAVVSGEGVALDLSRAGLGSRTVAGLLDLGVQVGALLVLLIFDGLLAAGDVAVLSAVLVVEIVLVFGGYPVVCEWRSGGRTLGKAALGLRVVRDDGGPIGFRHALVRGLSSLLLEKPGLIAPFGTAAGMITMLVNPSSKRIGDLMAGTFVLNERAATSAALVAPYFPVPYYLQPWAGIADLARLDDRLALRVRQFVLRAGDLTPAARDRIGADLARRVRAAVSPPPPPGTPDDALLLTVLAERRRRAEWSAAHSRVVPP